MKTLPKSKNDDFLSFIKAEREKIEKTTGKTPEQLLAEREKRITDAISLKEPDRVPVYMSISDFPTTYAGISPSAAYYEPEIFMRAYYKTILDFAPDSCGSPKSAGVSGTGMELLEITQIKWPGGNLPADSSLQFLDAENMKPEEYDIFITDPTDFMLRYYLPRRFGALEPLSRMLTPLGQSLTGNVPGFFWMSPVFATKEFQQIARKTVKAGQEQSKFSGWEGMTQLGFPRWAYPGGVCTASAIGTSHPFDWIADHLRGVKGIVEDMFKRPEKLMLACQRVLEWRLARATPADPKDKEHPKRVDGGVSHWCGDGFLSKKQFETFYWPFWKKALLATIDLGFIPSVYFENKVDDRIEYFLELPRGKAVLRFEQSDLPRAKSILRDHLCISGNVSAALLQYGSTQDVEEYCQDLIKKCGKGGGFVLAPGPGLTKEAKPDNVKALVESAMKYGRY